MAQAIGRVEWVLFDLDHTLYPPAAGLMRALDCRFTRTISRWLGISEPEADRLRRCYLRLYGSTVRGLQVHDHIRPGPFLEEVHDLPVERYLTKDPNLACLLDCIHAHKVVFTNGPARYARRVLQALGIEGCFSAVYDISFSDYLGKPFPQTYRRVAADLGANEPSSLLMVEDSVSNLRTARRLGWRTLYVGERLSGPQPSGRTLTPIPERQQVGPGVGALRSQQRLQPADYNAANLVEAGWVFRQLGLLDPAHQALWSRCAAVCLGTDKGREFGRRDVQPVQRL